MPATLQELLMPQFIMDLVSRVRPGQGPLGQWLGMQPTKFNPDAEKLEGPATMTGPLLVQGQIRYVTYRIFNYTRTVPSARAPGAGAGTLAQNPMGAVSVTCPRFHDKIPLNFEMLSNLSPMVGPNSQIDTNGASYIRQQTKFLMQKYGNAVEMMAAGMLRNSLYFVQQGDSWWPQFTPPAATVPPTPYFQVQWGIPASNMGQLVNMIPGGGQIIQIPWDNIGAPIFQNCLQIQSALVQLNNFPLTDVLVNSVMWNNIPQNTQIRNLGGIAQTPFAEFKYDDGKGMDGMPTGHQVATLRAIPWIKWHIINDVLALGGDIDISYQTANTTASKLIPDNMAIFAPPPSGDIAKLYMGGEMVVENEGQPAMMKMGYGFWHKFVSDPSAVELFALLNAIPVLYVPTAYVPATVIGFPPVPL